MKTGSARQTPALPLRPLIMLTSLVLLAHVWLLQASPMQWGPARDASAVRHRPFVTRTIEIKPVAAVTTATAPARPPPATRPVARTVRPQSEENKAPTFGRQAQSAIESTATPAAETLASGPGPNPITEVPAGPAELLPAVPATQAVATPGAAVALTIPGSARLKYAMTGRSKGMAYSAWAELEWLQDGQNYDARMVVSAPFLGARTLASSGRIGADGLAPTRFSDKSRSERAAHFEADKGKISFSANTPDVPWLRGAQDRVSVFVQLGSLLAGDPASYPAGSTVSLYTAGPSDASTWTFTVEAEEKLYLPNGEMSAVKLTRKPQGDYDQSIEVWLAPSMAYLPVRTRITQRNGDFVDQQMRVAEKP